MTQHISQSIPTFQPRPVQNGSHGIAVSELFLYMALGTPASAELFIDAIIFAYKNAIV